MDRQSRNTALSLLIYIAGHHLFRGDFQLIIKPCTMRHWSNHLSFHGKLDEDEEEKGGGGGQLGGGGAIL